MLFNFILMTLNEDDKSFVCSLYETHKSKIYEIANSILRNRHDAEEVVNEVMINVIKNSRIFLSAAR